MWHTSVVKYENDTSGAGAATAPASEAPQAKPAAARLGAIDAARGIAIIAVVFTHVNRGLAGAGILDGGSEAYQWMDRFFATWCMLLFPFLTGLFMRRSRERHGFWGFVRLRVVQWGYLYLLWFFLQSGVKLLVGDAANTTVSPVDLLQVWKVEGQLWFMPWMMIAEFFGALIMPWLSTRRTVITLVATGILSVVTWGIASPYVGLHGLALYVFYMAGTVTDPKKLAAWLDRFGSGFLWSVGLASVAIAWALTGLPLSPPTEGRPPSPVELLPLSIFTALLCASGMMLICTALSRTVLSKPLSVVGSRTLEIYLAHILAGAGARIVLDRLGVESPAVFMIVGTVAGVVLPLFARWALEKLHFPWFFEMPRLRRR